MQPINALGSVLAILMSFFLAFLARPDISGPLFRRRNFNSSAKIAKAHHFFKDHCYTSRKGTHEPMKRCYERVDAWKAPVHRIILR